jgi:flavin reductase (DIM6/NTAB) family NADH-FMN oxidoreductase RutF
MNNMKSFDTNGDFKDNYKFLIGGVLPRPIAAVSTRNEDGSNNLAPFSFFTVISAKPMILGFCPIMRASTGDIKDTVRNIHREKEFVINIVSEPIADLINKSSTELPYGQDEFDFTGLTPIDSEKVQAKRVKESLMHFECIFRDEISYGTTPGAGRILTGEVVKVHVAEHILEDGRIDSKKLQAVGRGAGNDWFRTDSTFEMERLMTAQIQK